MSNFSFMQTKKVDYLSTTGQRMVQARQQMLNACQVVADVNENWQAYKLADPDQANIDANALEFSDGARSLTAELVEPLATALDIIAGGTLVDQADPSQGVLTRQDLLDMLAAATGAGV